ncbi:MAG: large conductance mechanosensitive channel [Methylobacteriaceae bacterium]|jgi:large conductance mechanosensitive channel|nr:large conductance mechanosensitive channel [Methylobacteriaceae bacterium]
MLAEFRKFALRGNVIDLAIGVIIGAAFSKIVDSLVNDMIMPIVGAITGGLDFSNYYVPLTSAIQGHPAYADAKKAGAVLGYGQFLTVAISFMIIAFILFLVVREISKLERLAGLEKEAPAPTKTEALLTDIRDLLAKR